MREMVVSGNKLWKATRSFEEEVHANTIIDKLKGRSLTEIDQHCTKLLEMLWARRLKHSSDSV